jgi:hypothetical protein
VGLRNLWCAKCLAENISTIGRGWEYDILIASARYVGGRKVSWVGVMGVGKTRILLVDESKSKWEIKSSLQSFGGQSPPGWWDFWVDSAQRGSGVRRLSTVHFSHGWVYFYDGRSTGDTRRSNVSLRDNNVAQKASTMFSSYSSLQYKHFHIIISTLCCV